MSVVKRNNSVFPALMNELFKPDWFGGLESATSYLPAVNIKDNETEFELELSVPGRKKEDFNIEIDEDVLTVSSEVRTDEEKKTENFTRKEFTFSSFKRSFTLPETVDTEKIEANYENGILSFVLPKKEEALPKPKRLIELS
ncbi:Hsp20/alpha crystallin family protein [Maribacter algarum]|uniref:Hsp20/alpha crystallin family protein n=1 Tax=Maribacter algarum (ex Zhang et al. 2020) TaxID=2578118 RepID=A0A5S3PLV6_9FLAO|nr:Hsp20/alpha crystallin family protein [Maribacter algarum]TMM53254.1 Hsp20/alpha crystallin family protein [Maribacter algarum]